MPISQSVIAFVITSIIVDLPLRHQNMKQTLATLLTILSLFFVGSRVNASDEVALVGAESGKWTMDYEAALKLAAAKKLPVILNFTGSDWCGWCQFMDKNVFAGEAWQKFAADKVVLVTLDFPEDKLKVPQDYKIRNEALSQKFGIEGYPTYIVLDCDGSSVLGQLSAGQDKTPESFIQEFKDTTRFSAANLELYSTKHPDKAADLKTALTAFKKVQSDLNAWVATRPVQNDENNKKFEGFQKEMKAALEKLDTFK